MGLFTRITQAFSRQPAVDWDDLEALLLAGDLGASLTLRLIDELQHTGLKDADKVNTALQERLTGLLPGDAALPQPLPDGKPRVILFVGVNGTGKTTTTAKLGALLKQQGHKVVLAAADTFRAAAIEQLESWATRLDIPLVRGAYKSDPAAVCHDACQSAHNDGADFLLCDTAGRLHNRHNLMAELEKIRRTIGKFDPAAPHDTFLVVDATTGSNALQQARIFHQATPLTGLVITKLDGSGKGGVTVAIHEELKIPPVLIGTGEAVGDLAPFQREHFVQDLL